MSGKKISELQELLDLENDDLLLVVDADEANIANKSKSVKISTLKAEVGSPADKANVDLSNIVEATDLVQGSSTYKLKSDITFDKGDAAVTIRGKEYIGSPGGPSGELRIFSGAAADANSGGLLLNSGNIISGLGSSGDVTLRSGFLNPGVAGNSGKTTVSTGQTENGDSGNVEIITGAATGTRGSIILDASQVTVNSDIVLPVSNTSRVKNLANAADANDAVNKSQLDLVASDLADIQGIFEFQHTVAYQNNAGIYANGQPGVEDASLRSGWYYENLVSGEKINWYFFDGNPLSSTFMADIEVQNFAAYAVVTFDSIASRPFLSVYTLPTGTNDIIPGFAHSSFAYSQYPITPDIGRKYLIHIGEAPAIHPELPRIQLGLSIGLGDQAPTEKVLTAALSSDSGASVGNVQFVAEHVGVNAPNLKANAELKIAKQNLLVSATNIKTVNGASLLGSGNIAAATTNLSNLVTTAIPSGVDIISNSGSGVVFDVKTANSSTGNTGIASFGSGSSTAGSSAYAELITGTGTASTGSVYLETGKSSTGVSGAAIVTTGAISSGGLLNNSSNTSSTGAVFISSGISTNMSSTVPTGLVQILSGTSSSSGGSGAATLASGASSATAGTTGNVTVRSGDSVQINANVTTGQMLVRSGDVRGSNATGVSGPTLVRSGETINGNSGQVELTSGIVSGIGASGIVIVRSGGTNSGTSGAVEFSSGSSITGNSGNTIISTGTAGGTRGNIYLLSPVIFTNNTSTETVVTTKNGIVAANTIDLLNMTGSVYHKNLTTENTEFTFLVPADSGKKFTIVTKNATGSSYTVNFPTVKQKAGTINNTVAANTTSIFEFLLSNNEIYCISCVDNIV